MNPRVAEMAAHVAFDVADYTWVDLADYNKPDAHIQPHMHELQAYPVGKMPMLFEKMAVLTPTKYANDLAMTLERKQDVLHFAFWTKDNPASVCDARIFSDAQGEPTIDAEIESEVLADLIRVTGSREAAIDRMRDNVARMVAEVYCATIVESVVTQTYTCPSNPANAKRKRKGKLPLFEWKTILIDQVRVQQIRSDALPHKFREPCREHGVRGHWATRKDTGKRYWVKAHKRGDPSKGTIFHDYQLKGDTV